MSIAFLVTSPYQVFHYKWIARHFDSATAVLEQRDQDLGLSDAFVTEHMPNCDIERIRKEDLRQLDGRYTLIVCQTPILPLEFLERSYVVAQQYSLAKEVYQYGVWRAHAHLNLMYGEYSAQMVRGFSNAVAAGNPLLDPYFEADGTPARPSFPIGERRPRILYMPTYGDLSSAGSVISKLQGVDADITVKVHHAEDRARFREVPEGLRLVYSDTDPVSLFREHDGVISDYSGAAFDALYAGLPVVVTGTADASSKDFERLSSAERDQALLRDVAEVWRGNGDLMDVFLSATKRLSSEAYLDFRKQLFVNAGTAGAVCAGEIQRLIAEGTPDHFGAEQVRAATKRYIVANRELRGARSGTEEGAGAGSGPWRAGPSTARLLYRRSRRLLARSPLLRRAVRGLRRRIQARGDRYIDVPGPLPAPGPAERREAILQALMAYLHDTDVVIFRDTEEVGSDVAVEAAHRETIYQAVKAVGRERPDLTVRVGVDWRIVETLPIDRLRLLDLTGAHWIEVGSIKECGAYRISTGGFLTVLFVDYDPEKNRYLSLRRRSTRTDWTALVSAREKVSDGVTRAVGATRRHVAEPVDVVYTWVDSGDPEWRQAHRHYSSQFDVKNLSANNEERYIDREELRYSLRTLWMFAPFVRNVYIVTADQHPTWLRPDDPRVKVVSHREIFPDISVLPTFNSHSIESCLHRIPGLADHFLYLNDDVFLGRELTPSDFFTQAGLAKVRLSPSQYIYRGRPEPTAIPTDWAAYNAVSLMERDFGLAFDKRVQHVPMSLRRDVMADIEGRYRAEVERTRSARFRSVADIAMPSMLAHFYGIATSKAVEWPPQTNEYIYLDTGRHDSVDRFAQILKVRPKFFCLNATRHAEIGLADQARNVRSFLSRAFPVAAPWER